jgi:predicted site-specific integrase-resolvase
VKTYSTVKVAKMLKIGWSTLYRWIVEGRVKAPPVQSVNGLQIRLWTEEDIEKLKKFKIEHYWGRGSKKPRKRKKK